MQANIGTVIIKKLETLRKMRCETEITLLQKIGDTEQLGICDMGENDIVKESIIKVIPMTLASERGTTGEIANNMQLGNNVEKQFEFAEIVQESNIQTGDRIVYQKEEYIIFEILPIVMGETLICRQYKAKKVK